MKRTIYSLLVLFCLSWSAPTLFAGEGMWIPLLLKSLNEAEMQEMGMKMSVEDIYDVNNGSLKDAIVHFGGFCTSEIISPNGLLLTNHHCGYRQIQSHTTMENNYLKNGFWAKNYQEELPNPGLTATMISRIEDVTSVALAGVTDDMDEKTRQSTIDQNLNQIRNSIEKKEYEDILIRPFFKGNQYFMFITVTYKDIRLVGAPPDAIGKFGADTDNWVWPRHTGDFSLFRIYAGPDNLPAEYAEDNVPYQPKHFLPISLDGVKTGDFTMVFGFPGRTNEYLPSYAIKQIIETLNPSKIAIRDRALAVIDKAMRADEQVKIQYASKQAGIANYWKKWKGESLGITRTGGVDKKEKLEEEFTERIMTKPEWNADYGQLLPRFKELYAEIEPFALSRDFYSEINRNVELMRIYSRVDRMIEAYRNQGEPGYTEQKKRLMSYVDNFFKNYRPEIDEEVLSSIMELYLQKVDSMHQAPFVRSKMGNPRQVSSRVGRIYDMSNLVDKEKLMSILQKDPAAAVAQLKGDIGYQLGHSLMTAYRTRVAPSYNDLQDELDRLQRTYMKALMEVFPNKTFYPDANSTLRITYGKVYGYQPKDAVEYLPQTYLSGVIAKYEPGDYEFDLPAKLIELYEEKEYGPYGEDGKMPVCFIGTNHTTGGNSGSPAVDAYGNLIGLNFDRAWEGTMSDYTYDPSICRNIMVDIRYVLFIIDKYAGAGHLVEEMKLVHPKKS